MASFTAFSGESATIKPSISYESSAITVLPRFFASAISESVPQKPSTAIATSPARTTRRFLAIPSPVGIGISMYGFASNRELFGRIPTVNPPLDFAPLAAACITPPSPPQTRTASFSAINLPTRKAFPSAFRLGLCPPITDIQIFLRKLSIDFVV